MKSIKPVLAREDADLNNPEEHFAWALRNLPMVAGSGMMVFSGFLRKWSRHLWDCGFAHRDYLEALADEDGNIHVSRLPEQTIKFQEAFRGPHHQFNNAGRWVKGDEPTPAPMQIPNIEKLTTQEKYALLYQFQQAGMIPAPAAAPTLAEVEQEEAPAASGEEVL